MLIRIRLSQLLVCKDERQSDYFCWLLIEFVIVVSLILCPLNSLKVSCSSNFNCCVPGRFDNANKAKSADSRAEITNNGYVVSLKGSRQLCYHFQEIQHQIKRGNKRICSYRF